MTVPRRFRYFVRELDDQSYRPIPEAAFEVQIPGNDGPADRCAYMGRESDAAIALVEFTPEGPRLVPLENHGIPVPVIKAARKRREGFGEYVNEKGEVIRPSFLPPADG